MAAAAATTIVQVDRLVPLGGIDPETVVTPGIYVDRVVELGERPWVQGGEFVGGVTVEGAPLEAAAAASGSAAPATAAQGGN
jgi:3-oxoadipate CoA-transferase alpha subunit